MRTLTCRMSPLSSFWYESLSFVASPTFARASSKTFSSRFSRDSSRRRRDLLFCVEMALRAGGGERVGERGESMRRRAVSRVILASESFAVVGGGRALRCAAPRAAASEGKGAYIFFWISTCFVLPSKFLSILVDSCRTILACARMHPVLISFSTCCDARGASAGELGDSGARSLALE